MIAGELARALLQAHPPEWGREEAICQGREPEQLRTTCDAFCLPARSMCLCWGDAAAAIRAGFSGAPLVEPGPESMFSGCIMLHWEGAYGRRCMTCISNRRCPNPRRLLRAAPGLSKA